MRHYTASLLSVIKKNDMLQFVPILLNRSHRASISVDSVQLCTCLRKRTDLSLCYQYIAGNSTNYTVTAHSRESYSLWTRVHHIHLRPTTTLSLPTSRWTIVRKKVSQSYLIFCVKFSLTNRRHCCLQDSYVIIVCGTENERDSANRVTLWHDVMTSHFVT